MRKKLKSWDDVQKDMSPAGNPEDACEFGMLVNEICLQSMDVNNLASVDNHILAIQKVYADLSHWRKILDGRQNPKTIKKKRT